MKLGDVEILLIEKSQVTEFLAAKLPMVESEMTSLRLAYGSAQTNLQTAQSNYDLFEADKPNKDLESETDFLSNKIFLSYPDFNAEKLKCQNLRHTANDLSKTSDRWESEARDAQNAGNYDLAGNYSSYSESASSEAINVGEQADAEFSKLQDFVNQIEAEKLSALNAANAAESSAQAAFDCSPTPEDYLADFIPSAIQITRSDADGKFCFVYPKSESFTIYATAQRSVPMNGTEKYFWLIDAPTNSETGQIFLSNDNLVYSDPCGYFQIKPKEQTHILPSNQ